MSTKLVIAKKTILYSFLSFLSLTTITIADTKSDCDLPKPNRDLHLVSNYYIRNQSVDIDELTSKLKKYGIIAITGPAKSGKLQLAYYYAYKILPKQLSQNQSVLVHTIACDTPDILGESYYQLALALGMPPNQAQNAIHNIEMAKTYVQEKLSSASCKDQAMVLIFAGCNALSYKKLKSYLPTDLNLEKQKIIITSQQINFITDNKDKNFKIGGFSQDEAIDFLKEGSNITNEEAQKVVKIVSNLPYDLQAAKLYVERSNSKIPVSWDYYLDLKSDKKAASLIREKEFFLMQNRGFYNKTDSMQALPFINSLVLKFFLETTNHLTLQRKFLFKACSLFEHNNISLPILKYMLYKKFGLEEKIADIELNDFLEALENNDLLLDASPERIVIHYITHQISELQMKKELDSKKEAVEFAYGIETLMWVLEHNFLEAAKIIIDNGVDVNATNKSEQTALMFAAQYNNLEIIKMLIEKGANINKSDSLGHTALMIATYNNYLGVTQELIERGADMNKTDRYGDTALMLAAQNNNLEVIKMLIEKGADVSKANNSGENFIMLAAQRNNLEIIKLIINKGTGVNITDKDGWTAIMYAARGGFMELVQILVSNEANVNKANNLGWTALMFAVRGGFVEVVDFLISNGADVNATNKFGQTAFMLAVKNNRLKVAKLLIDKGANIDKADNSGYKARDYADKYKRKELAELLDKREDVKNDL